MLLTDILVAIPIGPPDAMTNTVTLPIPVPDTTGLMSARFQYLVGRIPVATGIAEWQTSNGLLLTIP